MRKLADRHACPRQPLRHPVRRRLTLKRGVHGQHHLPHPVKPPQKAIHVETLWTDPVEGRQHAPQHMIAAGEQARAIQRPEIRDMRHHADKRWIAPRVGAHPAGRGDIDVPARGTADQRLLHALKGRHQGRQDRLPVLDKMQDHPPGRTRPKPRKPCQKPLRQFEIIRHLVAACPCCYGLAMRLAFMGTPSFAVPALDALVAAGHEIACVYTQPPRPGNRGRILPSPVQLRATELGLAVRTPESLKPEAEKIAFAALNADAAVVAAYGLILPRAILAAPGLGCFNIHASLLPRWRGAAPIQRAILAGDTETGITIMMMEAGLDTGPMLLKAATPIGAKTAGELTDELARLGARLIVETFERLGELQAMPQEESEATYAAKIDKSEARIDWRHPADAIERQVRAFHPAPGTWFETPQGRVKLLAADVAEGQGQPGECLGAGLIACGNGALRPRLVQPASRAPMPADDWWRGARLSPGTRLS